MGKENTNKQKENGYEKEDHSNAPGRRYGAFRGGADRLRTAQASMDIDSMSFVVPAGTGDAILRYGCYLDRNGQMVLTILSRFDAFSARNNNVIRGSSSP